MSLNLDTVDMIVKTDLRIDVSNKNAANRMESLFISSHRLLRNHGAAWLLESNQNVAVYHVLSAICLRNLQDRLSSDLYFPYYEYKEKFLKFQFHAMEVAYDFQIVDNGPNWKREKDGNY